MKRFLTILCFLGCSLFASAQCEVSISADSSAVGLILTANTMNNLAVTFEWNTGETTQSIDANPGTFDYCVTAIYANGCIATACFGDVPAPDCAVDILTIQNGDWLQASATGTAPFTYSWNTGDTDMAIPIGTMDTLVCVTVTDADGCVATACIDVIVSCNTYVYQQNNPNGVTYLNASTYGNEPFVYSWSNGETTSNITPNAFGTYCVTVTDATDCESEYCYDYEAPSNCDVTIIGDGTGTGLDIQLEALVSNAVAPYQYSWTTGEATESIVVSTSGNYCVTITDSNGCTSSDCFGFTLPDCFVTIVEETTPAGGIVLVADAQGTAPIEYIWSTGEATQTIVPTTTGFYNVTIFTGSTLNDSCSTSAQYYYEHPCSGVIDASGSNTTSMDLCAVGSGVAPFTYLWNTGETTECINTNVTGTYSVIITDSNGCVAEICCLTLQFIPPNYTLSGTVYPFDSISGPVNLEGWVYLIGMNADGTASLLDSTEIVTSLNGFASFYDFGAVAAGDYLVKAALTEGSDNYEVTLPTYHFNELTWSEADVITVPTTSGWPFYNISMMPGDNPGGPGGIYGSVIVGDGFVLDPIPNVSILLFNESGEAVTYAVTDGNGEFAFPDLAWGTYQVWIDIPGQEAVWYWVTIGPDNPTATGLIFEVAETGITTNINEVLEVETFNVFPNPTSDYLNIQFNATKAADIQISLTSITGQRLLIENQQLTVGGQNIEMDVTNISTGIYFLNIADGKDVISQKVVIK